MIVRSSLVWLLSVAAMVGCNKAESENGGGGGGRKHFLIECRGRGQKANLREII